MNLPPTREEAIQHQEYNKSCDKFYNKEVCEFQLDENNLRRCRFNQLTRNCEDLPSQYQERATYGRTPEEAKKMLKERSEKLEGKLFQKDPKTGEVIHGPLKYYGYDLPNYELLALVLQQLVPYYNIQEDLDDRDKLFQALPSELPPNIKEAIINANVKGVEYELNRLYNDFIDNQYNVWHNSIRPNLELIKELTDSARMYNISDDYYQQNNDIQQFLVDKMYEAEKDMKRYMESRDRTHMLVYNNIIPKLFG